MKEFLSLKVYPFTLNFCLAFSRQKQNITTAFLVSSSSVLGFLVHSVVCLRLKKARKPNQPRQYIRFELENLRDPSK